MLKRVSWDNVDIVYQLDDAYEDRRTIWVVHATDRARVRLRIKKASAMMDPVLIKQRQRQFDALFYVQTIENRSSKRNFCCCM
jgi:hypothetical protein